MAERQAGVFVSRSSTDAWAPDADAPGGRDGPRGLGANHRRRRHSIDVGVGDLFSLPPGVQTTWEIRTPFKEMWVLASD